MATIVLKPFGGLVPRRGEQHLSSLHATVAVNAHLYSGELRPINGPALAHVFTPFDPYEPPQKEPDPPEDPD